MGLKLSFEKIMQKDDSKRVTRAESSISQLASEIALRVTQQTFNALQGRVENAESSLVLQANEIASKVSQSTHNALANRVASAESSIVQQANEIASKVSQTDYNGNTIASLINQTADQVTIQANRIKLEGLVTANNNFKVLPDGSIEAVNAKLSGSITATKMVAPTSPNYYGEIGVTDVGVGFGLFDTRFGNEAFFEVLEAISGNGFSIRDKNNKVRFYADLNTCQMLSPSGSVRIVASDTGVQIIKDGRVLDSWGY